MEMHGQPATVIIATTGVESYCIQTPVNQNVIRNNVRKMREISHL